MPPGHTPRIYGIMVQIKYEHIGLTTEGWLYERTHGYTTQGTILTENIKATTIIIAMILRAS